MGLLVLFLFVCCVVGFACIVAGACFLAIGFWEAAKLAWSDFWFDRACRLHAKKMAKATEAEASK